MLNHISQRNNLEGLSLEKLWILKFYYENQIDELIYHTVVSLYGKILCTILLRKQLKIFLFH